jgi:hypothetical protein
MLFNIRKLTKKRRISIILFFINIEIINNNRETIMKISKLINPVEQISDKNNMLNPCLGLIIFLIKPKYGMQKTNKTKTKVLKLILLLQ